MRILHYISKSRKADMLSDYLDALVSAQKNLADVQVIYHKNLKDSSALDFHPDIIHVHSVWGNGFTRLLKMAKERNIGIVVSPHWELMPYVMKNEQSMTKSVRTALYLKKNMQKADAVLATSEDELEIIKQSGWNDRYAFVDNSLLDSSYPIENMAADIIAFYRKVYDTRYQVLMTDNERQAIRTLLYAGGIHDASKIHVSEDNISLLQNIMGEEWQRIMLFADDERIRETIDMGIGRLKLNAPKIDTAEIDRFAPYHPKAEGDIERKELIDTGALNKDHINDIIEDKEYNIRELSTLLLNIRQEVKKGNLSLHHITELYDAVKYLDYDEDDFAETMKKLGLLKFSRRMIQILHDVMSLEEGFMPVQPLNDKGIKQIKDNTYLLI